MVPLRYLLSDRCGGRGLSAPLRLLSPTQFNQRRPQRTGEQLRSRNITAYEPAFSQAARPSGRCRMGESMYGLKPNSRRIVASLLLCFLAVVSVTSSVCPVCDRIEQPSTQHAGVHSADLNSTSSCERDGCSCCGFQFIATFFQPPIALSEFTAVPKVFAIRVPVAPVLRHYHPPRN